MAECIPIDAKGLNRECRNVAVFGCDSTALELAHRILALQGSEKMPLVIGTIGHIDHGITTVMKDFPINPIPLTPAELLPFMYGIPKKEKYKRKIDISKRRR